MCLIVINLSRIMKKDIDYSLIWKRLNDTLTKEEESEFQEWFDADEKHKTYYHQFKKNRSIDPSGNFKKNDSQKAWKDLYLTPRRKRKQIWQIASAACFLILIAGYLTWNLAPENQEFVLSDNNPIEPGIQTATLVLDNGKELELRAENDTFIYTNEVVIKNTDSKLNYQPNLKKSVKREYNKLLVPRGAEYYLELSDGTKVWVNSETIIRYPVLFGKRNRRIEVIGEAYFEVATDSLRPFVVSSAEHSVIVYGTSFNIKSYPEESTITTTLVEGKVKVLAKNGDTKEEFLSPGFQSVYRKNSSDFSKHPVNIKCFTSWKDGRFYFRKMPLEKMMKILGRWYDVEFVFNKEEDKSIRFNGNLKRYDNIQTILNQLKQTNELTFTAYAKKIYVN